MDKKLIIRVGVVVALAAIGAYVFLMDGSATPAPQQASNNMVIEVPPPTVVPVSEPVNERMRELSDEVAGALEARLLRQKEIEQIAMDSRREALRAEEERARAEIESAKAEQEESRLRARRAKTAPDQEPKPEVYQPHAMMMPEPSRVPAPPPEQAPRVKAPDNSGSRPKGLAGAELTMLSGSSAIVAIDNKNLRIAKGQAQQGYRLVSIDHDAKSVVLADAARGSQRTIYLSRSGGRVVPQVRNEKPQSDQASNFDMMPIDADIIY